jgi:hypothetical protein
MFNVCELGRLLIVTFSRAAPCHRESFDELKLLNFLAKVLNEFGES